MTKATADKEASPASPALAKLELLRAYWPEEDVRIDEGTIFEVDTFEALDLIETGVARKAKPDAVVTTIINFSGRPE